jgi:hypothetical protein
MPKTAPAASLTREKRVTDSQAITTTHTTQQQQQTHRYTQHNRITTTNIITIEQ